MNAEQVANLFDRSRREGKAWRARCPVHKGKSLTLAIYSDADRVGLNCFAGCAKDDILAAVGLTWKDLLYVPRERLTREAWIALQRTKEADEARKANLRIGEWILRFCERGYTAEDRDRDVRSLLAAAWVLSNKEITAWRSLFNVHLERILAADHCRERRMLPP